MALEYNKIRYTCIIDMFKLLSMVKYWLQVVLVENKRKFTPKGGSLAATSFGVNLTYLLVNIFDLGLSKFQIFSSVDKSSQREKSFD